MKKFLLNIGLWMFLLIVLIPMRVSAQSRDSLKLDEQGNVTLVSEYAAREGISSLSFSLSVDSVNAEKVEFLFNGSSAKVSEFRYNKDEKKLSVYIAGTEALFSENTDSLAVGRILVQDKNGSDTSASVSVVEDSLQYVYGTELKTAEDPELPGVVQIGTSSLPTPLPTLTPAPGSQGGSPGKEEDSGNDDDSDDDSEAGSSADRPGGTAGGAGSGTDKPGGTAGGAGNSTNKPGGTAAGAGGSANKPGGTAGGAGSSTDKPGVNAGGSDSSADKASQEIMEGNPDEPVIGGNNIRQEESETGRMGWIPVVVTIAVVIAAGAIAMAVVTLKKKPKDHES